MSRLVLSPQTPSISSHDAVLISVPPQIAGHRPGYRRIVVYRQDRGARFFILLSHDVHVSSPVFDRLFISYCELPPLSSDSPKAASTGIPYT